MSAASSDAWRNHPAYRRLTVGTVYPVQGPNRWIVADGDVRLPTDGRSYPVDDFPRLFDVIGRRYGGGGNEFRVPNTNGKAAHVPVDGDVSSLVAAWSGISSAPYDAEEDPMFGPEPQRQRRRRRINWGLVAAVAALAWVLTYV